MIIRSLKLENYKKYKNSFIEFPTGLFGIVGNNGAGKTSLVEAIAWAIYGNRRGAGASKDLPKREGADPGSDCSVELEFTLGSQTYRIIRGLRGRNETPYASLYVDNTEHTEGVTPVTKHLAHKLGMDRVSFFTSIFAKQKELDALSGLTPSARKKVILRLLRIDSIDVAIKNLHEYRKTLLAGVKMLKDGLQDMQELEVGLGGLKGEEAEQGEKILLMGNDAREAKAKNELLKKNLVRQEKDHTKYQRLEAKLEISENIRRAETENIEIHEGELGVLVPMSEELEKILPHLESLKTTKAEKERLEKIRDKFHEKTGFEEQIEDIDVRVSKLEKERSGIMGELEGSKTLEKQIKAVEMDVEKYDEQSRNDERELESQRTHLTGLEKQRGKLSREFGEIKKLGIKSECPICKKIIGDDLHKINEHYENEISRLDDEIESCVSTITTLDNEHGKSMSLLEGKKQERTELDESERQRVEDLSTKNGLDAQIRDAGKQRQKIQEKIAGIGDVRYDEGEYETAKESLGRLEQLDRERISLEAKTSRIPTVEKAMESSRAKLHKSETDICRIRDDMESLGFSEEKYEAAKEEYDRTNEHYREMEVSLTKEKGVLDMIKQKITQHDEQIKDARGKEKEVARMEGEIGILGMLDDIFNGFRAELISRIIPNLSILSSKLFKKITEEKYQKMTLSDDYGILIEDGGKQFPLERFSGGEVDLASLCLRIAISQIIREKTGSEGISFIILDEIFGSQDGARKNNILRALKEMSSQFRQIIVITHIDDVKEMLPYVLNIVENPDRSSRIVEEGMAKFDLD